MTGNRAAMKFVAEISEPKTELRKLQMRCNRTTQYARDVNEHFSFQFVALIIC
jgi:hypothetical protein